MRERSAPEWPEYQYEAALTIYQNAMRHILQKYYELNRSGADAQPDPNGVLNLDAANRLIDTLIEKQDKELRGSYAHTHWPSAKRPAYSMQRMPDSMKMAMWQEIEGVLAEQRAQEAAAAKAAQDEEPHSAEEVYIQSAAIEAGTC